MIRKWPVIILLLIIAGCSGDDPKSGASASGSPQSTSQQLPKKVNPLPGEIEEADQALQFTNRAIGVLTEGYYRLPDLLHESVNHYLKTWELAKMPRISGAERAARALAVPKGIFTEREAADLAKAQKEMDRTLASMLDRYAALEKYAVDSKIMDDGRQGRQLGKKINEVHVQFMKARNTWLEMLNKRASEAQKILLHDHPLERQIMAAEEIFVIFREIAAQLVLDKPDLAALHALSANLAEICARASRPPFPAAPALEREYRSFLKSVAAYLQNLDAGLREGFFPPQKKLLNRDLIACRNAWNIFARAANDPAAMKYQ